MTESTRSDAAFDTVAMLEPRHVDQLMQLYRQEWWTDERRRGDVELMLRSTGVVVALLESETADLAAFARVVTDRVYTGTLLDVIVREDLRGTGLGAAVMDAVLARPELTRLRTLALQCRVDMVSFYERWGFQVCLELPPREGMPEGRQMVRRVAETVDA